MLCMEMVKKNGTWCKTFAELASLALSPLFLFVYVKVIAIQMANKKKYFAMIKINLNWTSTMWPPLTRKLDPPLIVILAQIEYVWMYTEMCGVIWLVFLMINNNTTHIGWTSVRDWCIGFSCCNPGRNKTAKWVKKLIIQWLGIILLWVS